jgi:hypothetical protein
MTSYILGLDLGQTKDFTALAILEQTGMADSSGFPRPEYALRHLRRFPLGTPNTEIMPAVAPWFRLIRCRTHRSLWIRPASDVLLWTCCIRRRAGSCQ